MTTEEAKLAIKNVLKKEPLLGGRGFWPDNTFCNSNHGGTVESILKEFEEDQQYLYENTDAFIFVVETLSRINKIRSINKNIPSSYGLKHLIVKLPDASVPYMSNGIFIAGAIHCGFKYKKCDDPINAFFNMNSSSINRLRNAAKSIKKNERDSLKALGKHTGISHRF
ncbi:hypothetical protein AGMMS50267_13140 [Spirochaetia bacterium]|nr:hypothetical protein AGMMS50267_13140 [Spirochaetia bacterium]